MIKILKNGLKACAVAGAITMAGVAQAHPIWVLPSEFTVSSDEGEWLTFDATASHTVFGFDKGISLDAFAVYSPDGDKNRLGSYFKGHRRSVFDLYLDQTGTYRIHGQRPEFFFTSYKSGKRDKPKRMMANKMEAAKRLPEDAREVETLLIDVSTQTFVTNNAPTDSVMQPTGKGLELSFVTHPNDIFVGEETVFELLLDGKPVAGVEVEITPGGTRYRDNRNAIELTTAEDGRVAFTPEQAGPWLFYASLETAIENPMADKKYSGRYLTFEVIPE